MRYNSCNGTNDISKLRTTKEKHHIRWEVMFEHLLVYKRQHKGSTRVPSRWKCDTKLSSWVKWQRYLYQQKTKTMKEGRLSSSSNKIISTERIARLTSIGFLWNVPKQIKEKKTEEKKKILFSTATKRTRDNDNDDEKGTSSLLTSSTLEKKMRHSNSNNSNSNNDTSIVFKKVIKYGIGPSLINTVLQLPSLEIQHQLLAYLQQKEFEQRLQHQHQHQPHIISIRSKRSSTTPANKLFRGTQYR